MVGTDLNDRVLMTPARLAASASPISDKRGTAQYRKKVVAALCRRAIALHIREFKELSRGKTAESTINGEAKEFPCDADQSMLDVLRDELGLTGT